MTTEEVKIRTFMPRGYGKELATRTGCHPDYARRTVLQEDTNSYIWEEVLKLAEETKKERKARELRARKIKKSIS